MKKNKKTIIALILFVVLVAAAALVWYFNKPSNDTNSLLKTIEVSVVHGDGSEKSFEIKTNEEYLRGALEQEKLIEGDEGEYGLFITSVDGEEADSDAQQWWCLNDGEGVMLNTSIDDTAINDGDCYELILKTGW